MGPGHADSHRRRTLVDHWFRALDQQQVCSGERRIRLHVAGIHVHGSEAWIQFADPAGIVLRVDANTSVGRAVLALKRHLAHLRRGDYPTVIDALR